MKMDIRNPSGTWQILCTEKGFTLVELMISMVVAMIITAVVYTVHSVQTKSYSSQREISRIQQNLRAATYVLTWDIRNAQRDPSPRQRYRFNLPETGLYLPRPPDMASNAGLPGISFQSLRLDNSGDGIADTPQIITYRVRDVEAVPRPGLYRRADPPDPGGTGGWQLLAEGIQAIGYAYAFDADGDGRLERFNNNPDNRILWAVDSNNDGRLDAILDVNNDGVIDERDDSDGNGFITPADDALSHLSTPVPYDRVRVVRVFLLGVSERQSAENIIDNNFYAVGNRVIQPPQDRFIRRLVTIDVGLRNFIR